MHDVVIAGAGFAGIYAAWRLARAGRNVAVIEAAPSVGGNLNSREWNGYFLDNGTHNFDMRTGPGQEFYPDILGDRLMVFEDQEWATTNDRTWVPGFELPSFDDDPAFSAAALAELSRLKDAAPAPAPQTFADHLMAKFGPLLTERLEPMVVKYTGSPAADISADAAPLLGMFSRVRLGPDAEMIALKEQDGFWDDRLGVSFTAGDRRFMGANTIRRYAYPAEKGLTGFCLSADSRLRELGVELHLGTAVTGIANRGDHVAVQAGEAEITGRQLFWSMPDTILAKVLGLEFDLMSAAIPVGTAFFAFEVPADAVNGPDYLHDWHGGRAAFRYNKAGIYGRQVKEDGFTYVTAELPGHPARLREMVTEANRDRAWAGMLETGYLAPGTEFRDWTGWAHPVAYTLPRPGWRAPHDEAQRRIAETSDKITGIAFGYRGRRAFMSYYDDVLAAKLEG